MVSYVKLRRWNQKEGDDNSDFMLIEQNTDHYYRLYGDRYTKYYTCFLCIQILYMLFGSSRVLLPWCFKIMQQDINLHVFVSIDRSECKKKTFNIATSSTHKICEVDFEIAQIQRLFISKIESDFAILSAHWFFSICTVSHIYTLANTGFSLSVPSLSSIHLLRGYEQVFHNFVDTKGTIDNTSCYKAKIEKKV